MRRAHSLVVILTTACMFAVAIHSLPVAACSPVSTLPGTPAPDPFRRIVVLPTATLSAIETTDTFRTADAVFVGRVESVHGSNDEDRNVAQRADLAVTQVWKGVVAAHVTVVIPETLPNDTRPRAMSNCDILVYPFSGGGGGSPAGYTFVPHTDYLVFAQTIIGGFETRPGTGTIADTRATIATLGEGYRPRPVIVTPQSWSRLTVLAVFLGIAVIGSVVIVRVRKRSETGVW